LARIEVRRPSMCWRASTTMRFAHTPEPDTIATVWSGWGTGKHDEDVSTRCAGATGREEACESEEMAAARIGGNCAHGLATVDLGPRRPDLGSSWPYWRRQCGGGGGGGVRWGLDESAAG
jgi:hypothetical protein